MRLQLPGPSAPDAARAHARRDQAARAALSVRHQVALNVARTCAGDEYIKNPNGARGTLQWQLLPEGITAAMDDHEIPRDWRVEIRETVKLWYRLERDGANAVPFMMDICPMSGVQNERDICPLGTPGCGCRRWFEGFAA